MQNKSLLNKLGITTKVLVIATLPVVIVSIVLAYYVTNERINDAYQSLTDRGLTLANHVATMSEFGLFTDNRELLQTYTDAAIKEQDIVLAIIKNRHDQPVAISYNKTKEPDTLDLDTLSQNNIPDNLLMFSTSVKESDIGIDDFNDEFTENSQQANSSSAPLGFVTIIVSTESTLGLQQKIVKNSISITLLGILVSVLIALRIGRSITQPVLNLTNMEKELRQGKFHTRIPILSGKELGALEKGFNALADSLERADELSKEQISLATVKLEQTVKELEYKNKQLNLARQEALQASQAKADFLARMSHEIRTPMNAVIGFTNLLRKTDLNQEQHEYTRTISQSSRQLLTVIDDVLNFSKINAGSVELELIPTDIRACFEDIVSMLSPAAHEKGLELVLLVHSDVPQCLEGDPTRINQILTNLVDNAIKFTDSGGVTIRVETLDQDETTANIKVSVTDQGVGISPEEQKSLFTAFSQADVTISRRFGGTGLGLTIAKHFVNLMGGEIKLISEKNKGSTFYFTLSCKKLEPLMEKNWENLNGLRICVFDTHPFSLRSIRNNLLAVNTEVFAVKNINQLVQQFSQEHHNPAFDILILGLSSREVANSELDSRLKKIQSFHSGPILVLLGTNESEFPSPQAYDAQVTFMSKPIRRDSLYSKIQQTLNTGLPKLAGHPQITEGIPPLEQPAKYHILVAEDNKFNRQLVSTILQQNSIKVSEAVNGEEAIQKASENTYDLILMDIHLPIIDGATATEIIRSNSICNKNIPIIALTADVFAAENDNLPKNRINDFLFKPIVETKLWSTLNKWLPQRHGSELDLPIKNTFNANEMPQELLDKLHDALKEQIDLLKNAMANQDMKTLSDQAHQLCGLAGYFSLPHIETQARDLEDALRNRYDKDEIAIRYNKVIKTIETLISSHS